LVKIAACAARIVIMMQRTEQSCMPSEYWRSNATLQEDDDRSVNTATSITPWPPEATSYTEKHASGRYRRLIFEVKKCGWLISRKTSNTQ
jgi:hypothetical protein